MLSDTSSPVLDLTTGLTETSEARSLPGFQLVRSQVDTLGPDVGQIYLFFS